MNRIARTFAQLTVATGIAAAITLTGTAAHADTPAFPGDGISLDAPTPEPNPLPAPPEPKQPKPNTPQGPGVIKNAPTCTHGCNGPSKPEDKAPAPADKPADEPAEQPAEQPSDEQVPADQPDQGCFTGCDLPEEPVTDVESVAVPSTVDPVVPAADADADATGVVADAPAAEEDGSPFSTAIWASVAMALLALLALVVAALRRRQAHHA